MYHPTSRVLAVLELLQSHRRMTGTDLAKRLEVNIRTLRRYITTLQDIGIPIDAERGRYGAYTLGVGFRLPPMMFTNDEGLALAIGLLAAEKIAHINNGIAVESARAKLQHVLPHELKQQLQSLQDSIQLDLTSNSTSTPANSLLKISSAIRDNRQIYLHYRASNQATSERYFDPYGIACRRGLWYVVGWCHLREDLRSFRLERILEIDLTDTTFEASRDFNALTYITQSLATLERQFTFEVLLDSDIETVKNEVFEVFGILEARLDGILLRGSADDIDWVARQLAALPFDFIIHSPIELQEALHRHARQLLAIANKK